HLRANEGIRRRAPRIQGGFLDVADIARHEVAVQRNDVTFNYGESNFERLPLRERHYLVLWSIVWWRRLSRWAPFKRNQRKRNTKAVHIFGRQHQLAPLVGHRHVIHPAQSAPDNLLAQQLAMKRSESEYVSNIVRVPAFAQHVHADDAADVLTR